MRCLHDKHGHDFLYAGGELRRLTRSVRPQRAATAVRGAALALDASPVPDRLPRSLGASAAGGCPAATQSVWGTTPPGGHLSLSGRANRTDSDIPPGSRGRKRPATPCRTPTAAPASGVILPRQRNGSCSDLIPSGHLLDYIPAFQL